MGKFLYDVTQSLCLTNTREEIGIREIIIRYNVHEAIFISTLPISVLI